MYKQTFFNKNFFNELELNQAIEKANNFLQKNKLPESLKICFASDDLKEISEIIELDYGHYVIFGTGGSSLIGQLISNITLCDKISFFDNIDPEIFSLDKFNPSKTLFIFISKSGETIETLSQLLSIPPEINSNNILIITEDKNSTLKRIAEEFKIKFLPHPQNIGGRFSAFSITGILPCYISGFDPIKFRQGAIYAIENKLEEITIASAILAMSIIYKIPIMPIINYGTRLEKLSSWLIQLISESLGKDGFGITPLQALGTIYQHSQLQLFLDGPKDKYFNIIYSNKNIKNIEFNSKYKINNKLRTMSEVFDLARNSAIEVLKDTSMPIRVIALDDLSEESIGSFLSASILEIITCAHILGINPFDQNAVEKIKKLINVNF